MKKSAAVEEVAAPGSLTGPAGAVEGGNGGPRGQPQILTASPGSSGDKELHDDQVQASGSSAEPDAEEEVLESGAAVEVASPGP